MDEGLTVGIVGEDGLARRGLGALLTPLGVQIVASCHPADLETMADAYPDVWLWDGADPPADLHPVLALVEDATGAAAALGAGASGVVHRDGSADLVDGAIRAVASGLHVRDPLFADVTRQLDTGPMPGYEPLTPREGEVLEQLAYGLSNREIGEVLGITARTARFHVAALLQKLGAESRTEAVVLAARAGLIVL